MARPQPPGNPPALNAIGQWPPQPWPPLPRPGPRSPAHQGLVALPARPRCGAERGSARPARASCRAPRSGGQAAGPAAPRRQAPPPVRRCRSRQVQVRHFGANGGCVLRVDPPVGAANAQAQGRALELPPWQASGCGRDALPLAARAGPLRPTPESPPGNQGCPPDLRHLHSLLPAGQPALPGQTTPWPGHGPAGDHQPGSPPSHRALNQPRFRT